MLIGIYKGNIDLKWVNSSYSLGSSYKKIVLYSPNVLNYFQPVSLFSNKKQC